ncbi:hypothetical protein ACIP96_30505 [Streptomyces nigra]|uniref:hypothetical protein n=1 Tax=Streptomyces nigra TaxID=1827580 RepID=UPI00380C7833
MEIAKLVLEFIKVLVWPLVLLGALVFFRSEARDLMQRLRVVRGGIAEAEFAEQAAQARAESEVAASVVDQSPDVALPYLVDLLRAAGHSPEKVIWQAWESLERELESAVLALGLKRRHRGHPIGGLNVNYVAPKLVEQGLPESAGLALIELSRARSQISELGASAQGARDFIQACNNLYRQLSQLVESHAQDAA